VRVMTLQIYHDSGNSLIEESGVGNLIIRGSGNVDIQPSGGGAYMARFAASGASSLYYNNAQKLATTATGIDVTGTATMDGLVLGDNEWIYAGSGADLKIGHDGTDSIVRSQGSPLYIDANGTTFRGYSPYTKHMEIATNGDISFYEDTGTTAKFFWDASAESLGIGTSLPSSSYSIDAVKGIRSSGDAPNFTLQETDASNQSWSMGSYAGTFAVRDITVSGTSYPFRIEAATPSNTLYLDSSGNVGIGESNPQELLHLTDTIPIFRMEGASRTYQQYVSGTSFFIRDVTAGFNRVTLDSSGNVGIGTTPNWVLQTGNLRGSSTAPSFAGTGDGFAVDVYNEPNPYERHISLAALGAGTAVADMSFYVDNGSAAVQAMTIDSSGTLLVGKTGAGTNTAGSQIDPTGRANFTVAANFGLLVNRLTSDGELARFQKDGTTVGSIGTNSNIYLVGTSSGLRIRANDIIPVDATGAGNDNALDLGIASQRWKDLYLSGGVYLGGTVAANLLDDYEEGTWTPTVAGDATGVITTGATGSYYTKVGNMVTIYGSVRVTTNFTSNQIGGLPFALAFTGSATSFLGVGNILGSATNTVGLSIGNSSTTLEFHNNQNIGSQHDLDTSVEYYRFQFTYRAA
jgi:hypothetical protein